MSAIHARASLPASWGRLRRVQQIESRVRRKISTAEPTLDPITSAEVANLHYVNDAVQPGIRRLGRGKRVRYVSPAGKRISSREVLARIKSLAIPPAWTDVWICTLPHGHLQATGRDARGRKQYRYHPRWREVRDHVKYGRLRAFASALPRIRARTAADLEVAGLPRCKVVATVVKLLEKTLIRVGNDEYARQNHSFGLTTLRDGHAKVNGTSVRFNFRGKSGVSHSVDLHDARLARIVRACRDLPGHELFQYIDDDGNRQAIGSADVNEYLREVTGQPFTSKDFRTWAGTVLVARALAESHALGRKRPSPREIVRAVKVAAARLGNTAAVCRKCYIHPAVLSAYMDGRCIEIRRSRTRPRTAEAAYSADEAAVMRLLDERK